MSAIFFSIYSNEELNQKVNNKNNSSNSLVFGSWPQTKIRSRDLNRGNWGSEHKCYLCATPPPQSSSILSLLVLLTVSFLSFCFCPFSSWPKSSGSFQPFSRFQSALLTVLWSRSNLSKTLFQQIISSFFFTAIEALGLFKKLESFLTAVLE